MTLPQRTSAKPPAPPPSIYTWAYRQWIRGRPQDNLPGKLHAVPTPRVGGPLWNDAAVCGYRPRGFAAWADDRTVKDQKVCCRSCASVVRRG